MESNPYRSASSQDQEPSRCLYCGARWAFGVEACARCGLARVGEAKAGSDPTGRPCPRCRIPLAPHEIDGGRVAIVACESCHGAFVSRRAWNLLLDDVSAREHDVGLGREVPAAPARALAPTDLLPLVRCPSCSSDMDRMPFARRAEAILDVCPAHGMWFDGGELVRTVAIFRRLEAGEAIEVADVPEELEPWKREMLEGHLIRLETAYAEATSPTRIRVVVTKGPGAGIEGAALASMQASIDQLKMRLGR